MRPPLQKFDYFSDPAKWDRALGRHLASLSASHFAFLHEHAPLEFLQQMRIRRLASLLAHAAKNIPLYRDLYRDVTVGGIRGESDLARFPILTRTELKKDRAGTRNILQEAGTRSLPGKTSGSTGEPLRYAKDALFTIERRELKHRFWRWAGVRPDAPKVCSAPESARNYYPNMLFLHPHQIRSRLGEYIERIRQSRAEAVFGTPLLAFDLFWEINRAGAGITLRRAVLGGHHTSPGIRNFFRDAFDCEVFEFYACGELGFMAYECEAHFGLHIQEENTVIEVVDDNGRPVPPDAPGNVLLTTLSNEVMPFIRYEIGDRGAVLSRPCPCGRTSRRLVIEGRNEEFLFSAPNGETLAPSVFRDVLDDYFAYFQRYQLTQEDPRTLILRIVPTELFRPDLLEDVERRLREVIPDGIKLSTEVVESIAPMPGGKFQYFISPYWKRKFPATLLEPASLEARIAAG